AARDPVSDSATTIASAARVAAVIAARPRPPRRTSSAAPATIVIGSAASRYIAAMFGYWKLPLARGRPKTSKLLRWNGVSAAAAPFQILPAGQRVDGDRCGRQRQRDVEDQLD